MGASDDHCSAKHHAQVYLMECLEGQSNICKFSIAFSETFICRCSLRKFVTINFDEPYAKDNRK